MGCVIAFFNSSRFEPAVESETNKRVTYLGDMFRKGYKVIGSSD